MTGHEITVEDHSIENFPSWDAACSCGKWFVTNWPSQEQVLDHHEQHCIWIANLERGSCPNYAKLEGCDCRHCTGVCLCARNPVARKGKKQS